MPHVPCRRRALRGPAALIALLVLAVLALAPPASASVVWAKNPGSSAQATIAPQIWIANDDGSNARLLYQPPQLLPGMRSPYGVAFVHDPQLSADGKTLTFSAQWSHRYFSGSANTCGMFCEGVYQVHAGTVARITPTPSTAANGCDGSAIGDLCGTFETDPVVADSAGTIVFEDTQDYWVNCGAGGCPAVPSAIYHLLRAYVPQANGTYGLADIFSWSNDCSGASGSEPRGTSFASNGDDLVMVGCENGGSTAVRMTDANGAFRDIARIYTGVDALSLSPDGTRVVMSGARPNDTVTANVWSFEPVAGGIADTFWLAIQPDDPGGNDALNVVVGGSYLYSGAYDGELHRWPLGCGPQITCRFGVDDVKITSDSGRVYNGSYWDNRLVDNDDPSWTRATSASLGAVTPPPPPPPAKPVISKVGARCTTAKGKCRLRLSWTASKAGTVMLTVKPFRKPAFSVSYTVKAGKASRTLAPRKLPRGKTIVVTARLKAGGVRSAAVTVRPILR